MKPVVVMTDSEKTQTDEVEIVHIPLIGIEMLPVKSDYLHRHYDWLIFTSKNAVKLFFKVYPTITYDKVAAIGSKTAEVLNDYGIIIDYMPTEFNQEKFIAEAAGRFKGSRCCLPVSQKARSLMYDHLAAQGEVDRIDLYRPIASRSAADLINAMIEEEKVDVLTFMSPSAVKAYYSHYNPVRIPVIAVGPVTRDALLRVQQTCVTPDGATKEQMIKKILEMREHNEF
ncbi:uroporphyrinogen-III synthase [Macrococcus hajekii]|uniref:Uroporphyrinogen-III synthase n=1 Tax=Macrococcus hajekii TaxID=198482 RepID=A0A4R6BLW0_9STAP|nr:uroporphyrinogen-III synthase [Macrococcus hajekii]TDM02789.1 uroporphyrinogen-III synthase [Macrococcus hajekii]GGB03898.1 uroporphyrinogen III methyltransferase [Macrococcus hajekii]